LSRKSNFVSTSLADDLEPIQREDHCTERTRVAAIA
jgi:hypothetical protein